MAIRIAIASHDGLTSDVKFGELDRLYIYEFDDVNKSFFEVETRYVPGYDGNGEPENREADVTGCNENGIPDGRMNGSRICGTGCPGAGNGAGCQDETRIISIARLIGDCEYLLLQKIGMKPARVLLREGISVLEKGGNIDESLLSLSSYVAKRRQALRTDADLSD